MKYNIRKIMIFLLIIFIFYFNQTLQARVPLIEEYKTYSREELINALNSENKYIRKHAIDEIKRRKDLKLAPNLIKMLKNKKYEVNHSSICKALGEIRAKSAEKILIKKIRDKKTHWKTRESAIIALIKIESMDRKKQFPYFLIALENECGKKRKKGEVFRLDHYGISDELYVEKIFEEQIINFIKKEKQKYFYINKIIKSLDNNNKIFKYRLAFILGEFKVKESLPVLLECLKKTKIISMKGRSAYYLGKLGIKRIDIIEALKKILNDPYLSPGAIVTIEVGEKMEKHKCNKCFNLHEIEKGEKFYRIRDYTLRNAAASALTKSGIKVVKENNKYKVLE